MPLYDWSGIPAESLNSDTTRQVIHADNVTVVRVHLRKGALVPEHSHSNEQITMLLAGRLKLVSEGQEEVVEAGQVVWMRSNVPHRVEALEESAAIEVFAPRRDDWVSTDSCGSAPGR